jgi:antitoxin component of RelBE/YafQ-DinJ toxin-antitoxin module
MVVDIPYHRCIDLHAAYLFSFLLSDKIKHLHQAKIASQQKYIDYKNKEEQRLTSLLLIKHGWTIRRGGYEIRVQGVRYHPSRRTLSLGRAGIDLSTLFKAFVMSDREAVKEVMEQYEHYWDDLRELMEKINHYRIPIYVLMTKNEVKDPFETGALLSEAFIRINKSGVQIGNTELLASLASTILGARVAKKLRELDRKVDRKYGLSPSIVLRMFIKILGLKQTDLARIPLGKLSSLRQRIRGIDEKDVLLKLEFLEEAIERVMKALTDRLGSAFTNLLPSHTALIAPNN